jgi:hypothetical protein
MQYVDPYRRGSLVDATQTEGIAEVNRKRTVEMSMKYLDLFLQWSCCSPLLAMGLFPDGKEITESVGCLWAVKMHLEQSLKLSDHQVTCIVVGDGARPRTAALACFMTKWRRVISIDPAITPETMTEFEQVHRIDRLEMRPARMQDTVIEVDPEKDECVVIILPHAHVCPNAAIAQLHFQESNSGEEQHTQETRLKKLPRVAIVQLPCCAYEFHDRCAGQSADVSFHDYGIASLARLVRCWWDVGPEAQRTGALSVGSKKAKICLDFPHSSSMDRRGWKRKAREARQARKNVRREKTLKIRQGGATTRLPAASATAPLRSAA